MNAARQVGAGAAAAATTIIVARVLGPSGAGAYAVALATIALLSIVSTLGLDIGVTFRVARGLWTAGDAFRTTLAVGSFIALVAAVAGFVTRLLAPSAFAGLSVPLTVAALAVLPFVLAAIFATSCAVATDRYEIYSLIPILQAALGLLATTAGALAFGLAGAVVGMAIATALVGCGSVAWGLRLPLGEQGSRLGQLRSALRFGIASYGANALQLINYRLDLFILSVVSSSAAVGQYSVAVAVSSVLWLLPRGLSDLVFPRVAQLGDTGAENQRDMVETKAIRHATLVVAATSVVLAAAVELLIVPVFGEAFRPAINLTLILIPGAAAAAVARVFAAIVVGRGKSHYGLYAGLMTTPFTIALYVSLIPWLGASGAALASTISYCTSLLLFAWFFRRTSEKRVLPLLIPTGSEVDDFRALAHSAATFLRRVRT